MTEDLKRRDAAYDDLVNRRNQLEQELSEKKALVTKRETNVKTVSQELIKVIDVLSGMYLISEQDLLSEQAGIFHLSHGKLRVGWKIVQK